MSSGSGTLSWLTFLPCSPVFAALSGSAGVHATGWIITALVTVAGVILVRIAAHGARHPQVPVLMAAAPG